MIYDLELKPENENKARLGTSCCICEGFIPIYSVYDTPDRLCDECRKRLRELLYPTADTRGEE